MPIPVAAAKALAGVAMTAVSAISQGASAKQSADVQADILESQGQRVCNVRKLRLQAASHKGESWICYA